MNFRKLWEKMEKSKGYYIALVLCAVAIGTAGYVYVKNADKPEKDSASLAAQGTEGKEDSVAVIGTVPAASVPAATTEPQQTTAPTGKKPMKTAAPISGETIGEYAMDCLSYNETTRDWRVHNGVDIAADRGAEVHAAADGTVYTVFEDDLMGTTVVIRHEDGYTTQYASLSPEVLVTVGERVTLGQTIGTVDNTALVENALGDHLHFSVSKNDEPVDPDEFLGMN